LVRLHDFVIFLVSGVAVHSGEDISELRDIVSA
jgi:hypothetical protein